MKINTSIYDAILKAVYEDTLPPLIQDPLGKYIASEYADKLLIANFHCDFENYNTPEYILKNAFTAGFFTQILNSLTDLKEPTNYQLISTLLLDNVYVVEGWAETFLHANFPDLRKTLTKLIYRTLKPCQFLTYQINEEISLRDMWTIIYTVFLLGFCAETPPFVREQAQ